jgi:hypothetical protein
MPTIPLSSTLKWSAGAVGVAALAYGGYAGQAWLRYGHPSRPRPEEADDLLDQFVPAYDVVERHHVDVAAPAAIALDVACEQDLSSLPIVNAIFKIRELVLGATPDGAARPRGLVALTQSLGWGVLAHEPGREIVMGGVTRPWEPNVVFRSIPPQEFAGFNEPGYVKIAWTLRADQHGAGTCVLRTETRAVATDAAARAKFRRYWSAFSAGIVLIRRISLAQARCDAERRARTADAQPGRETTAISA